MVTELTCWWEELKGELRVDPFELRVRMAASFYGEDETVAMTYGWGGSDRRLWS